MMENQYPVLSSSHILVKCSNIECGETIEQVETNLKAHEAFQNLIGQQEEKVLSLQDHANKLIQQKHFDKDNIRAKLVEILERRENIVTLCTHKLNLLKLNLLHAQFKQVGDWRHCNALEYFVTKPSVGRQ